MIALSTFFFFWNAHVHDRNSVRMHSITVAVSDGEDFHTNSYTEHEKTQELKGVPNTLHGVLFFLHAGEETREKTRTDQGASWGVSMRASDCHGFSPRVTVSKFGSFSDWYIQCSSYFF